MDERHISQQVQILVERWEYFGNDIFNLSTEIEQLRHPVTSASISQDVVDKIRRRFLERIQYRLSHDGARLLPVSAVFDPREHEEWYESWLSNNNNDAGSFYWKRLEFFLSHQLSSQYGPESAGRVVRSIDDATHTILGKLANPRRSSFSYKGLVVGYVQSGKTANFTALIAKAVDAGYKLIVVLAGIHNVLRRQTQVRLDRELTGVRDIQGPGNYIPQPGSAKSWHRLTAAHNDFSTTNLGLFENYCRSENPSLAVVKKNVRVLNRLIEFFEGASEEERSKMPVLIIDDEADQASVDGNANDPDSDPTRTNDRIRTILRLFSRKAYIGYTATPFANVLINMSTEDAVLEDDLYPRNFIVSLPEPSGYFGTSTIFRSDLSGCFVRDVPDERNELVRHGQMTENLSTAVDEFILCCAVRNLRGDKQKPMSMLVHVSHKIADMTIVKQILLNDDMSSQGYLNQIRNRYNDPSEKEILEVEYSSIWADFVGNARLIDNQLELQNYLPDFQEIWDEVEHVLSALKVVELNSDSDDVLDYTTGEEIKVIAVGGNQLSRGLTLEGLMTSYYLRVNQNMAYDTLLQMARWFGYRKNYEDLTRIHTTEQIWEYFEHLALVEQALRDEIYRYEEEVLTPLQMAVAIMAHQTLRVTAPNKIGAARLRQSSYSKSLNQTIWLPLNAPDKLQRNYDLGEEFIREVEVTVGFSHIHGTGVHLAKGVNGENVLREFLNRYEFVDNRTLNDPSLNDENLLAYIHRRLYDQPAELTSWNVALVGNKNPVYEASPISYGGLSINRVGRSRKYTLYGYNIGVLTESDHLKIDLHGNATSPYDGRSPQSPLLLLYVVAKESQARATGSNPQPNQNPEPGQRVDLYYNIPSEQVDVLGVAIVLPQSLQEPQSFVGQ